MTSGQALHAAQGSEVQAAVGSVFDKQHDHRQPLGWVKHISFIEVIMNFNYNNIVGWTTKKITAHAR